MIICMDCKAQMLPKGIHLNITMKNNDVGTGNLFACPFCKLEIVTEFNILPEVYFSEKQQRFVRKGEI